MYQLDLQFQSTVTQCAVLWAVKTSSFPQGCKQGGDEAEAENIVNGTHS